MRIGFAKCDISPPVLPEGDLSIPMLGWRWERAKAYREIHDPLFARAMAAVGDGNAAVVLSCDLFGDAMGLCERAAQQIETRFGVPGHRVLFGCTHTHTSPDTLNICRQPVAPWWVDRLVGQLADVAGVALAAARPATLLWAEAPCPGVAINRRTRYLTRYEQEHGPVPAAVRDRNMAVDETLRVLWAMDAAGQPFGAILNFGCHPVVMQTAPMVSADYCGPAAGITEQGFTPGFVSLYLNGPCGDINPACNSTLQYQDCEVLGGRLARQAIEIIRKPAEAQPVGDGPISGAIKTVPVESQELPNAHALRAEEKVWAEKCQQATAAGILPKDGSHPINRLVHLQECLSVEDRPRRSDAVLHGLRIGDVRFISFPGELLSALAQDIRRSLPGKLMLAHCSRGHLGYICPREVFLVGGYEPGPGTWAWLREGCGEQVAAAAAELGQTI